MDGQASLVLLPVLRGDISNIYGPAMIELTDSENYCILVRACMHQSDIAIMFHVYGPTDAHLVAMSGSHFKNMIGTPLYSYGKIYYEVY